MKKTITRLLSAVVCVFLVITLGLTAFAAEGFSEEYYRLMDIADLLTDKEEEMLLAALDEISERQKMEVAIATVESLEDYNDIQDFADDLYEFCNYGYGENRDGVMFVISMEEREWYISTCGYGITAFTDAGIEYIGGLMKDELSEGNYAAAFHIYTAACDELITQAKEGHPFDRSDLPREPLSPVMLPITFVIGLGLAVLVVKIMKGQLQTVHSQNTARNYVRTGSLNITQSRDQFLYNRIERTKKAERSSGGSGSSTHKSSSGTRHGGGGGKF